MAAGVNMHEILSKSQSSQFPVLDKVENGFSSIGLNNPLARAAAAGGIVLAAEALLAPSWVYNDDNKFRSVKTSHYWVPPVVAAVVCGMFI